MMPASEGEGCYGKAVREVAGISYYKSDPNPDKGEGVKNPKILQMSYMHAPLCKWCALARCAGDDGISNHIK